jgi:hypothetical protein
LEEEALWASGACLWILWRTPVLGSWSVSAQRSSVASSPSVTFRNTQDNRSGTSWSFIALAGPPGYLQEWPACVTVRYGSHTLFLHPTSVSTAGEPGQLGD